MGDFRKYLTQLYHYGHSGVTSNCTAAAASESITNQHAFFLDPPLPLNYKEENLFLRGDSYHHPTIGLLLNHNNGTDAGTLLSQDDMLLTQLRDVLSLGPTVTTTNASDSLTSESVSRVVFLTIIFPSISLRLQSWNQLSRAFHRKTGVAGPYRESFELLPEMTLREIIEPRIGSMREGNNHRI